MPSGNQEPRRDPELKRKAWPLCQHSDNETETKRECSVVIPDDWQLTSQQQAFIELFAEDDQPKQ